MKPDLVYYHGNCYDGFTAAWLLRKVFPAATYRGLVHGKAESAVAHAMGRKVLMVDFSLPREQMELMNEAADELLVLDHHKTAEAELEGLDFARFDMDRCGCMMAYDWLATGVASASQVSALARFYGRLQLVQDRDLWTKALAHTDAFHAFLSSFPMTFESWDRAFETGYEEALAAGKAIRRSIDRYCEKVGAETERIDTPWGSVNIVNAPYLNASELAHWILGQNASAMWSCAWFRRGDGRFQYSLRGRMGFDVSGIARDYGGGGHAQAAGFDSGLPPWELWE